MLPRLTLVPIALIALGFAAPAQAVPIAGLTAGGELFTFDSARPGKTSRVKITGVQGKILGIDVRPADKKLYLVSDNGTLYTINRQTGAATAGGKLSSAFQGGEKAVVDFNPQADRLRLMGVSGVNFRIVPDSGAVTTDGKLAFAANDRNAGKSPWITAAAYTNSFAGARGTELFTIDSKLDALLLQSPPNDGAQQTRGALGVDFGPNASFDIMPTPDGGNIAYAVSGKTLYTIHLETGRAKKVRELRGLPPLVDIAILPAN